MNPESETKQSTNEWQQRLDQALESQPELEAIPLDHLMERLRARAETRNRAAQAELPAPSMQSDSDWQEREAWVHDGQPIYGELKDFAHAAYIAAKAGDQVAFSRQKDLLYKAVMTFVGTPPMPTDEVPIEITPGPIALLP